MFAPESKIQMVVMLTAVRTDFCNLTILLLIIETGLPCWHIFSDGWHKYFCFPTAALSMDVFFSSSVLQPQLEWDKLYQPGEVRPLCSSQLYRFLGVLGHFCLFLLQKGINTVGPHFHAFAFCGFSYAWSTVVQNY